MSSHIHLGWHEEFRFSFSSQNLAHKSYKIVSTCVVHHPSLFDNRGAPPFGVFDRLDHTHQWNVGAGGRASRETKDADQ